nr:hypothetical protein [Gottfriedia acidiceleris]
MSDKFKEIVNWVEDINVRNRSSASALIIIKDNNIVLENYNGFHSNSDNAIPVTQTSKFNIASARKSYFKQKKMRV